MATAPIDGMPGWVVRELSVVEWHDLESIRLDESVAMEIRTQKWLATLMAYSVESEKGERRWSDVCEVKIGEVVRHGEAVSNAAVQLNGFGEIEPGN